MTTPAGGFSASINTFLPHVPDTLNPELYQELLVLYRGIQNIQIGIDYLTRDSKTYDFAATYGQIVNLYPSGGITHVRLASAAVAPIPALAFVSPFAGVANGAIGDVCYSGKMVGLVGLTHGSIYYLSDVTPGAIQLAKPVGVGKIVQPVGFAIDDTTLWFNPTLLYTTL